MQIRFIDCCLLALILFAGCTRSGQEESLSAAESASNAAVPDEVLKLGEHLFSQTCSTCHIDSIGSLAPSTGVLASMTPRAIYSALSNGKMVEQAKNLSEDQRKVGGIHWGMASDGKLIYAANADNPYALDLRDSLVKADPGLFALDIQTGEVIWKAEPAPCDTTRNTCLPVNSAAPTLIPGVVFAGDLNGKLRAYSAVDGAVLWQFDTVREFDGVNGIKAKGGSMDGPGPLVADGMLFVNSGYDYFGEMAGNALLAFTVK